MATNTSDNTWGPAKWVVSPTAGQGHFTTITSAMAAAASGDSIYVREGTYTENFTMTAGTQLFGSREAIVNGTITMTAAGTYNIQGLSLQTNAVNIIAISGANAVNAFVWDCFFTVSNA